MHWEPEVAAKPAEFIPVVNKIPLGKANTVKSVGNATPSSHSQRAGGFTYTLSLPRELIELKNAVLEVDGFMTRSVTDEKKSSFHLTASCCVYDIYGWDVTHINTIQYGDIIHRIIITS